MGTSPNWAIQEFCTPECTSLEFQLGHVTRALIKEEIYIYRQPIQRCGQKKAKKKRQDF